VVSIPVSSAVSGGAGSGSGSSSNGSNTGAIVGGVVGGVVGLICIVIALLLLFRQRRRSHRADFDDMMFDPSREQNHGTIDLADPSAPVVEPYHAPGIASTAVSPQMTQYPGSAATTSDGGFGQNVSRGPSSATSAGFAGRGANAYAGGGEEVPMPIPQPTGAAPEVAGLGAAGALGGAAAMSAKQREAYQEQQRFRVQNQGGPIGQTASGSSGSGAEPMSPTPTQTSGGVTVHQDAGRPVEDEEDEPPYGSEIPPTYDSIRR